MGDLNIDLAKRGAPGTKEVRPMVHNLKVTQHITISPVFIIRKKPLVKKEKKIIWGRSYEKY